LNAVQGESKLAFRRVSPPQGKNFEQRAGRKEAAAILAADVVGYSRLMGADEEGTLERLKTLRNVAQAEVGDLAEGIAFSPDGRFLYVGNFVDGNIDVLRRDGDG
jgi:class 3 adenylate cyclase